MPTYSAEVRDSRGNSRTETVFADSIIDAREKLRSKGLSIVKDFREYRGFSVAGVQQNIKDFQMSMIKVSVKDKAVFSRQFAAMVNAGVAIVRCLGVLSDQCSNAKLKRALESISADVQQGVNLSESLRKHPDCFDNLYCAMIEAGEVGGVLDEVLNRLAKVLEDMNRLQGQIKGAMAYPVVVGVLALIIFLAMTIFILPTFAGIFKQIGAELPALTVFMLWISEILRSVYVFIPIGAVIGFQMLFSWYYKTPVGRLQIDKMMLKLPILGDLVEKSAVARFTRIFGTLTRSGVPILNCLDIVGDTAGNQVIKNAVNSCKQAIQQGGMLSIALAEANVFPALAIQMISIGEETGEIDAMMMKVADFYEMEVEEAVKALTSVLEPLMMVVLAAMVGVILLSMYLPMFAVFEKFG